MSATPEEVTGGPYRSMPRRRTPPEKRAVRQRRVARIVLARARSWIGYTAFWVTAAVAGAFMLGGMSTAPERGEVERHAKRAAFYLNLFDHQVETFNGLYSVTKACQDRELRRMGIYPTIAVRSRTP